MTNGNDVKYRWVMRERSSSDDHWQDVNESAADTGDNDSSEEPAVPAAPEKNPYAAALGRLGGKKGGPARAMKLSAQRRSEIARKAAEARWHGKQATGNDER